MEQCSSKKREPEVPKNLVIVESGAKAKTIEKILGPSFRVESCYGHIKDLPKKKLGVDIENNFETTYQIIPGKGKILKKLKALSKKMDEIYLATDLDREGEAISWHLSQELSHPKKVRIVFNQVTREALKKAVENPGDIDMSKVDAQQGRRVLDRLVGYKISPLLWKKVKRGLSAGRVQSVAVRLICEREEEIEKFSSREYWTISAKFSPSGKARSLEAKLCSVEGKKAKIAREEEAEEHAEKIGREAFRVAGWEEKEKTRSPSPPFTTSTLQQVAGYQLGFSSAKTMKLAQNLYEGQDIGGKERMGLITYMRTDSMRIAKEAQLEARNFLKGEFSKEFIPQRMPIYKNRKSSQDAHEAIRPTKASRTPASVKNYLSKDHLKLYTLIWKRFLASQMEKALIKTSTLDIQGGEYVFKTQATEIKFPGFMRVYKEKAEKESLLPPLKKGAKLKLEEITSRQEFTQPPSRYTEASLVKTLEEKGIGRPSTYAPTISTIRQRRYVNWERGALIPTPLARLVTELLVENFSTILDTEFTACMEEGLDTVETGKKKWNRLVEEFYQHFEKELRAAKSAMRDVKKEGLKIPETRCKKCGGRMTLKFGRWGEFLACSNYPDCKNTMPVMKKTGVRCPFSECKGEIIKRVSHKGKVFYGCSRFPECKFASPGEPIDKSCPHCTSTYLVRFKDGFKCPTCKKILKDEIVMKRRIGKIPYKIIKKGSNETRVG